MRKQGGKREGERARRRAGVLSGSLRLSLTGVSPHPTNPSEAAGLGWGKPPLEAQFPNPTDSSEVAGLHWRKAPPEAQLPVGERPLFPVQVIFAKRFVSTLGRKSPPEVI